MPSPTQSEFALFQKLANPHKTDFSRKKNTNSVFKRAVRNEILSGDNVSYTKKKFSPVNEERSPRSRSSVSSESSYESGHKSPSPEYHKPQSMFEDEDKKWVPYSSAPEYSQPKNHDDPELLEEINNEKQGYLIQLSKLEQQGVSLSRKYTMEDSLEAIQFEHDRQQSNLDTMNTVNFLRDTLFMGFRGIELANAHFGPILELNGWADSASADKTRYNHVLERLYKKHWRKGNMSPEMEFMWLIGSSMGMYHVQQKFSGGASRAPPINISGIGSMFTNMFTPPSTNNKPKETPQDRPIMKKPEVSAFKLPQMPGVNKMVASPPADIPSPLGFQQPHVDETNKQVENELRNIRRQMEMEMEQMKQTTLKLREELRIQQEVNKQHEQQRQQQQFFQPIHQQPVQPVVQQPIQPIVQPPRKQSPVREVSREAAMMENDELIGYASDVSSYRSSRSQTSDEEKTISIVGGTTKRRATKTKPLVLAF